MAYGDLLTQARQRAGLSKRALGAKLAERAGLDAESGRRAIYKYEKEGEEPERARAAILAVILDEPALALVAEPAVKRQRRRGALEARVEGLEDRQKSGLAKVTARLARLEGRLKRLEQQGAPQQTESK